MASEEEDDESNAKPQAISNLTTKVVPRAWSPSETLHLIDAYQEKWEQLKRGLLRASHWDDVARSLASRSTSSSISKSSVQCRHKLEKLRRRYRSECRLLRPSLWPFFQRMDLLERGPDALRSGPPSASPSLPDMLRHRPRLRSDDIPSSARLHDQDDDEDEDSDQPPPSKIRSLKRVRGDDELYRNLQKNGYSFRDGEPRRMASAYEAAENFKKSGGVVGKKTASGPYAELASVIRSLGEGFLHMEQLKIQMHRETERFRADMEVRRTEMVLESQRQIADLFTGALSGNDGKNRRKDETDEDV